MPTESLINGGTSGHSLVCGHCSAAGAENWRAARQHQFSTVCIWRAVPNVFHEIASGNNMVACQVGSVDLCSSGRRDPGTRQERGDSQTIGLGSLESYNLTVSNWPDYGLTDNPGSIAVQRGGSNAATVSVTALNGFTGNVTLSCSVASSLTNTTCSIPGNVSNSS